MRRSLVGVLCLVAMLLVAVPAGAGDEHPFIDVSPDAPYADAVSWLYQAGLTTGTTPTTFSPDEPVDRAQMVTLLWRMRGLPAAPSTTFADVQDSAFYADAVDWAQAVHITTGTTATTFSPEEPVTRGQAATFLARSFFVPTSGFVDTAVATFDDIDPRGFAAGPIGWLLAEGLTTGTGPRTYSPERHLSRQELARFLFRIAHSDLLDVAPGPLPFAVVDGEHDDLATDGVGNVYVAGSFGPDSPIGEAAGFVVLDADGEVVGGRAVAGEVDPPRHIAAQADGSVCLSAADYLQCWDAGGSSTIDTTVDGEIHDLLAVDGGWLIGGETGASLGAPNAGETDAFVRLVDDAGTTVWTHQYGTAMRDTVSSLNSTDGGEIVVAGRSKAAPTREWDPWVGRLGVDGGLRWRVDVAPDLGEDPGLPSVQERIQQIVLDAHGTIWVLLTYIDDGSTYSDRDIITIGGDGSDPTTRFTLAFDTIRAFALIEGSGLLFLSVWEPDSYFFGAFPRVSFRTFDGEPMWDDLQISRSNRLPTDLLRSSDGHPLVLAQRENDSVLLRYRLS